MDAHKSIEIYSIASMSFIHRRECAKDICATKLQNTPNIELGSRYEWWHIGVRGIQMLAMLDCINRASYTAKWVFLNDVDE